MWFCVQWLSQDFKVKGTPVTWPEGPMRGWGFWGGQRSGSPHQLGGLGESYHYPPLKNLGFARILWPCLSTVADGVAALLFVCVWALCVF